ncbi:hypothetical protein SAMN02910357_01720 [Succinivibrio dextrinosolvens]|uniref:hypothetical protein n=1 Tax=Succinivibrio dextrinosolvens TaxID=83771 RepID=UPI0008F332D2|nr:hypothetical protein [Succinivibrio dextrinosolvens]SFS76761.1 hypothetical protein SAMN02910357_01720 [Succinivibrio dextrinosolvens]
MSDLESLRKHLSCGKCNSKNIEVTTSLPSKDEGFIGGLLRKLNDSTTQFGPLSGRFFVICKDCGHVSMIQK